MTKGLILPMLTGNTLIDILKDQAKSLMFTKNKVELEVGDPKRKVFLEPLWLLNANPTQIDFQLRTFISASEMQTLLADIKQAQIDITEMALQIAGSGLQLRPDDFLAGLKNGSLAYNKETKEVSQNGVVIYKAQPKTEPVTEPQPITESDEDHTLGDHYMGGQPTFTLPPMTLEELQAEPMTTVEATIAQTFPSNQLVEKYGGPMTLEKIQAVQVQLEVNNIPRKSKRTKAVQDKIDELSQPEVAPKPKKTTAKKKAEAIVDAPTKPKRTRKPASDA